MRKAISGEMKIVPAGSLTSGEFERYTGQNAQSYIDGTAVISPTAKRPKTMDDFWIKMGWYEDLPNDIRKLRNGKWQDNPLVRADAVKFLIKDVLKKDPRDTIRDDFNSNRLGGLIKNHYNNSPYKALREAGYDINPWEMSVAPNGFYNDPENRTHAVRWLVGESGKDPRDITQDDFYKNRLGGLVRNHYNGSPYEALREAELVDEKDENYMRTRGHFGVGGC